MGSSGWQRLANWLARMESLVVFTLNNANCMRLSIHAYESDRGVQMTTEEELRELRQMVQRLTEENANLKVARAREDAWIVAPPATPVLETLTNEEEHGGC